MAQTPYKKKYTNADYYTDGKFNEDVAKQAFLDMFEHYGIPFTPFLEENFWVNDFGLGDFENVGDVYLQGLDIDHTLYLFAQHHSYMVECSHIVSIFSLDCTELRG